MSSAPRLRLSVLDQSPIPEGGTAGQAIANTLELARLAEALGYTRFWVSEHHNTSSLAGSTPEVLLARLGVETTHIRLGSGGVMLPHYSALKVAENFRMLETLYPGRIDLGVGRAPGGDRLTASLLNPSNRFDENDFIEQLQDLDRYLTDGGGGAPGSARAQVRATPVTPTVPERWLLSSSGQSGLFAAYLGWAFSFAHFINPLGGPPMMQLYRERFQASLLLTVPQTAVAIFVLCADTAQKAQELEDTMVLQMIRLERGERVSFPPYEQIRDYPYTPAERERAAYQRQRMVSGTPEQVKPRLEALATAYGTDEIIVVTITHAFADRRRSYELLAQAFGLTPAPSSGRPTPLPGL